MLIRLRRCTSWSAPLLFAYGSNRFSYDMANFMTNQAMDKVENDVTSQDTAKSTESCVYSKGRLASLPICSIWSQSPMSKSRSFGSLVIHRVPNEDWSDYVDAQTDMSLCLAHISLDCSASAQSYNVMILTFWSDIIHAISHSVR